MKIVWVGKTKQNFIKDGIDEYQKRVRKYTSLKIHEIADCKRSKNRDIMQVKEIEGDSLLKSVSDNDYVILLDERGKNFDSVAFSKKINEIELHHNLLFIIAGVYGVHEKVKKRADLILSFSSFTFTHQMIRLLLMEQLYRAITITNNKQYHY